MVKLCDIWEEISECVITEQIVSESSKIRESW